MCGKICSKFVAAIVIIVALVLAVVVSVWHQQSINYIIYVSRFFDVMLPVLAVGALLKYLLCGHHGQCCHSHQDEHEHGSCCK